MMLALTSVPTPALEQQGGTGEEVKPIASAPNQQSPEDVAVGIMMDLSKGSGEYRKKRKDGIYDSIAVTLANCTESHIDNFTLNQCYGAALDSYNTLLGQIYRSALKKNTRGTREVLAVSQQEWVSFREAEDKAQSSYRKSQMGSAMGIVLIDKNISAIRERISELVMYLGIGLV
jgi:uncharacterized protein YecT (DUF1311 family)